MEEIIKLLSELNVEVIETLPETDITDAGIILGGKYDGINISVGRGYYCIITVGRFRVFQCNENSNLSEELEKALNYKCDKMTHLD